MCNYTGKLMVEKPQTKSLVPTKYLYPYLKKNRNIVAIQVGFSFGDTGHFCHCTHSVEAMVEVQEHTHDS